MLTLLLQRSKLDKLRGRGNENSYGRYNHALILRVCVLTLLMREVFIPSIPPTAVQPQGTDVSVIVPRIEIPLF